MLVASVRAGAKLSSDKLLKRALDCLQNERQFNVMYYFTNQDWTRRVPD